MFEPQFAELTFEEKVLIKQISTLIQHSKEPEKATQLIDILAKKGLTAIVKKSIMDPEFDNLCKSNLLNPFWESEPGKKLNISPQKTVDRFDLLKGHVLYQASKKGKDYIRKGFFQEAINAGNFTALGEVARQQSTDSLKAATTAANLYGTPGYLLLTSLHWNNKNYQAALLSLITAEKLEPHSEASMKNVGKKLNEIFPDFTDWTTTRDKIIQTGKISENYIKIIENQADKNFNQIKDKFDQPAANDDHPQALPGL